jgi:transposase
MSVQESIEGAPLVASPTAAGGAQVLDSPEVARIVALQQQGWGSRRIASELGLARGTVQRYLILGGPRPYARRRLPSPVADHLPWLRERFLALRGNGVVLLREVRARGLALGYSTLARVVAPWRAELAAAAAVTLRYETPPGRQLQVDFGELRVLVAGVLTVVHLAVLTLGYSRRCFVRAFLAERQEHWLAALEDGFRHFGGVPRELLVDNARALVRARDATTGQVHFTEAFLAFCRLHGTTPRACWPFRARTKGKVESGVKYVKRNALAGQTFASFAALEAHLAAWLRDVADVRVHGTTHERPCDRFVVEQAALQPVKVVAAVMPARRRKVAADCLVDVDTNRYSVPHRYVGRHVDVVLQDGEVRIQCDGLEIARHVVLRARYRTTLVPAHTEGLWPQRTQPATAVHHDTFDAPLAVYEALATGAAR